MNIGYKLALAATSGIACWVIFSLEFGSESESTFGVLIFYGLSGLLFAGGVLFPCLRRDRWVAYRAIGLVIVSTFSYWSAIYVSASFDSVFVPSASGFDDLFPGIGAFVSSSLVGALFVLAGAKFIIPLSHPRQLALTGVPAAILGGLAFSGPPFLGMAEDSFVLSYAAWHVLLAVVIHFSEKRNL